MKHEYDHSCPESQNRRIIASEAVVVFAASAAAAVHVFAVIAVSVAGAAVRLVAF